MTKSGVEGKGPISHVVMLNLFQHPSGRTRLGRGLGATVQLGCG